VVHCPFTFLRANRAAERLFPGLTGLQAGQLIDLWLGPGPFRATVRNWAQVMLAGLSCAGMPLPLATRRPSRLAAAGRDSSWGEHWPGPRHQRRRAGRLPGIRI
jgi:hypothetical protein